MRVADRLVSLYPAPVRRRWGAALLADTLSTGARAWPDVLGAGAGLWLSPGSWPESWRGQRRGRVATVAFVLAAVAVLATRLVGPDPKAASLALAFLLVGLLLAAPRPVLTVVALQRFCVRLLRRAAMPAGCLGAVVGWAMLHPNTPLSPAWRALLVTGYWGALVVGAVQVCRVVAELGPTLARPAPASAVRTGLLLVSAGVGCTGAGVAVRAVADRSPVAAAAALVLAVAVLVGIRQLREENALR